MDRARRTGLVLRQRDGERRRLAVAGGCLLQVLAHPRLLLRVASAQGDRRRMLWRRRQSRRKLNPRHPRPPALGWMEGSAAARDEQIRRRAAAATGRIRHRRHRRLCRDRRLRQPTLVGRSPPDGRGRGRGQPPREGRRGRTAHRCYGGRRAGCGASGARTDGLRRDEGVARCCTALGASHAAGGDAGWVGRAGCSGSVCGRALDGLASGGELRECHGRGGARCEPLPTRGGRHRRDAPVLRTRLKSTQSRRRRRGRRGRAATTSGERAWSDACDHVRPPRGRQRASLPELSPRLAV